MLAIWSLVPLPFLNPNFISGSFQFTYCWSLAWRILNIALLAYGWVQLWGSLNILWEYCPSLGLELKLTLSSPVPTAEFSKFAGILNEALQQPSSFRIWNSSAGIPSPPLVLFIVMLPKAHLISHSRISGSTWVITSPCDYLGCEDLFCTVLLCILATS